MRLAARLTFVPALTGVAPVQNTAAHGPCDCLFPTLAEPGVKVTIGLPAYRVLLNPRPAQFGIAPGYLASAGWYRPNRVRAALSTAPVEYGPRSRL